MALTVTTKKSDDLPIPGRVHCYWMPSWLMKLQLQREAFERMGHPRAVINGVDVEAELDAIMQLHHCMMTDDQVRTVRLAAIDRADAYCMKLCDRALDPIDMAERAELCAKILAYEGLREQMERES